MKQLVIFLLWVSLALVPWTPARASYFYASGVVTTVTQDFDSYTAATSLATFSGWTVPDNAFVTVSGGTVRSNTSSDDCIAIYEPSGFTTAANHQVEVTLDGTASSSGRNQGAACAIQATGQCYFCYLDGDGTLYFGYQSAGGTSAEYLSHATGTSGAQTGVRIRMTTTGTGTARRCTAEYNTGSGWTTPSGWNLRDFPIDVDGGKCGLAGYSNNTDLKITSITISNQ